MASRLADLAALIGGKLAGDGSGLITAASTLSAALPGEITLVDHADKLPRLAASQASAVVVPSGLTVDRPAIEVDNVRGAFARIVTHFRPRRPQRRCGVSPLAMVSASARLADDVDVHCGATIGDEVSIGSGSTIHAGATLMAGCRIGSNVTIFPRATLYEDTIVGDNCIIHAGAVLGAYGFGYSQVGSRHVLSEQLGWVELGNQVEVGAGSTIDRGTYGPTSIGEGTKIDNLVQIGHNCRIGRHNMICAQVGIAGSTTTGDYVVIAGQAGVRDHVHVGQRAVIGGQTGVSSNVEDGANLLGTPALPISQQRVIFAIIARLPELRKQIKQLQSDVDALHGRHDRSKAA